LAVHQEKAKDFLTQWQKNDSLFTKNVLEYT
jgi:hypothetical protein